MRSLRILAVPERERKAQTLLVVAEAGDAILAPVIGARARLIVGKVAPSVAVLAVVLPYGSPLALAEIGPPQLPQVPDVPALLKARLFHRPGAIYDWLTGHRLPLRGTADYLARQLSKINCGSSGVGQAWAKAARSDIFNSSTEVVCPGDKMRAKIVSDMVSRRKAFSIIGLSVAFGFLGDHEPPTGRHDRRQTGAQVTLRSLKQAPT
jgi:hypothetical protein